MTERVERHLAAIVAIDIAGYSSLMRKDEQRTFERMLRRRREVIDPGVESHQGRIVKGTGDGILAEFASAQEAIRSTVEIQKALAEANAAEPDAAPMVARIGITIGDIIFKDGDIFGDGVNIAVRLEGKAPPGGICVSGRLLDDLRQIGILFGDWGELTLKNIDQPVRVYCIHPDGAVAQQAPKPVEKGYRRINRRVVLAGGGLIVAAAGGGGYLWWGRSGKGRSIAVLPFANLSGDPRQSYLGDGMAEELRSALARIAGLRVIARMSSEAVARLDAVAAANRLGVSDILTGSVRISATAIRIAAQLVDGFSGVEKWSSSYDQSVGDALSIQADIAQQVAEALVGRLASGEKSSIKDFGTTSAAAQDLLLRAVDIKNKEEGEAAERRSLDLVRAAITLDPRYAEAQAQDAKGPSNLATFYAPNDKTQREWFREAENLARKAIGLDHRCASGYAALGYIQQAMLSPRAALDSYRKAVAFGGDAAVLSGCSFFLAEIGHADESIAIAAKAVAADPLNPASFSALGNAQYFAGQYEAAIASLRRMLALAPKRYYARYFIALSLIELGKSEAALAELAYMPEHDIFRAEATAVLHARAGDKAASERTFPASRDEENWGLTAAVYSQRGDKDQAMKFLQKAWAGKSPDILDVKFDPLFAPLRNDSRFRALLAQVAYP